MALETFSSPLRFVLLLVTGLAVTGLAPALEAASGVPARESDLVDGAPMIVEGRVVAVTPAPGTPDGVTVPATDHRLVVDRKLKGLETVDGDVVVRLPGGVGSDGIGLWVPGTPSLPEGTEALFFLAPREDGTFDLLATFAKSSRAKSSRAKSSQDESPTAGCAEELPLRWFDFETFHQIWFVGLNGQPGLVGGGASEFREGLRSWTRDPYSVVSWSLVTPSAASGGLTRPDGFNMITFDDPRDEIPGSYETTGVLTRTGVWFDCAVVREHRGQRYVAILEVDVVTQDGAGDFLASLEDPGRAAEELFAHEAGHALGFGHSTDPDALMWDVPHNDGRGAALLVDDLRQLYGHYAAESLADEPSPPLAIPAAPPSPELSLASPDEILLTWENDPRQPVSNVRVERRSASESPFRLRAAVAGEGLFVDRIEPGTTYTYRLVAQNAAGASEPSEVTSLNVPEDLRPAPPVNLWSAANGPRRVRLSWRSPPQPGTFFVLEVRPGNGAFQEVPVDVPWDTRRLDVTGLPAGDRLTFRLRVRRGDVTSVPSNETTSAVFGGGRCSGRNRVCLDEGRFSVRVDFWTDGVRQRARAVPATDRSGFFDFTSEGDLEVVVRFAEEDGRPVVYYRSFSDANHRLVFIDHRTGEIRRRRRRAGVCPPAGSLRFPALEKRAVATIAEGLDVRRLGVRRLRVRWPAAEDVPSKDADVCRDDELRICLDDRFEVLAIGHGTGRGVGHFASDQGATAVFATGESNEPAAFIKIVDATAETGYYQLFAGAPPTGPETPGDVIVRIDDIGTGTPRIFGVDANARCPVVDAAAFE